MARMEEQPWLSDAARAFRADALAELEALGLDELDDELHRLVAEQERHVDEECVVLYAGTNALNPRVARLLASTISARPNLGHPGDKLNRGMAHAERLEVLADLVARRLLRARHVELRVASGSLANLYAYMATTRPGDRILAFTDAAAGHPTHGPDGAAGLYGLEVHELPFDAARMDVDVDRLFVTASRVEPRLMIVAGSMCLHPYALADVRAVADAVGATVLYDAAHMGGLIAGGRFQDPLGEGAHVLTGSTYKSFGGPAAAFVATDAPGLAERLDRIAFPGLTANFDLARTAALALAMLDLAAFGEAYADAQIENARALAAALAEAGVDVFTCDRGPTSSQHVAIAAHRYGGATPAARALEAANVLCSTIGLPLPEIRGDANALRLGTQEVTRRGMGPAEMAEIAELVARVLVREEDPASVRLAAVDLRGRFQGLAFVRPAPAHAGLAR
jgi:glycine hydroxymethyltransferase